MAEIVNLRHARKLKARADREAIAAENRVRYGRSRAEKRAAGDERAKADAFVEGHRLQRLDGDGD